MVKQNLFILSLCVMSHFFNPLAHAEERYGDVPELVSEANQFVQIALHNNDITKIDVKERTAWTESEKWDTLPSDQKRVFLIYVALYFDKEAGQRLLNGIIVSSENDEMLGKINGLDEIEVFDRDNRANKVDKPRIMDIVKQRERILEKIKLKQRINENSIFELKLIHRNVDRKNKNLDFSEFNFVIEYKTEPESIVLVDTDVASILLTAFDVLSKEGFFPEKNKIKIRCRAIMKESLRGKAVYYSFGKGHWSYNEYEDPIQFRSRWDHFTDGE